MMVAPMLAHCDDTFSAIQALHNMPHHHAHHHEEHDGHPRKTMVGNSSSDEDDEDVEENLCHQSEKCVSSCAAYGRVCPCAARAAAQAVHEKIEKLVQNSILFESGPPEFQRIDSSQIAMGEKLGEGGFSNVNSCVLKSKDGSISSKENEHAVKFLKRKIMVEIRHFRHGAADLATEAFFLGKLDHPGIIKIHGITAGDCEKNVATGKDCGFFIVVDRLQETLDKRIEAWRTEVAAQPHSIFHRISKDYKDRQKIMLSDRLRVALDIASVMEYLHSLNIAYRDLKPDNVGFDKNGTLKLFDFGLAKEEKETDRHANGGGYRMTGQTGSRRYMAPEVAQDKPYDKSVDVYSFGMLCWEMCALEKPFQGYTSNKHMSLVVLGGERPPIDSFHCPQWPTKLQELIKKCWSSNPQLRPNFADIKIELAQIMDSCTMSCANRIQGHVVGVVHTHNTTAARVPPPPMGGFASMKPNTRRGLRTRSAGDANTSDTTTLTTPTLPPPEKSRRHWSFGFVLKSHQSPTSSPRGGSPHGRRP